MIASVSTLTSKVENNHRLRGAPKSHLSDM
jgi:hypothetical protein